MDDYVPNVNGWIQQEHDERDLLFSAPLTALELPPEVNLAETSMGPLGAPFEPALDQEDLGACGPHSATEHLIYDQMAFGAPEVLMPSRLFIYWITRELMGTVNQDSGVDHRRLLKALNKTGWCRESLWEYDINRFTQRPPQACFKEAAKNKIMQYRAVPQTVEQMKACLAGSSGQQGRPFLFGFSVFPSYRDRETTRTGIIPDPQEGEDPVGGHSMLAVGYDAVGLILKQHYRKTWGKNGYGRISWRYAANPTWSADFWTMYTPGSFAV